MPVCQNGHDQPDFAKFCGTCGSSVSATVILEPDQVDSGLSDPGTATPIDLDLMQDENDVTGAPDTDAALDVDDDSTDDDSTDDDSTDDDSTDDDSTDSDDDPTDNDASTTVDLNDDADVAELLRRKSDAQVLSTIFGTTVNASAMQLLHDWAEDINELEDPYVKGLTTAVARRDDLSVWASLDPLELLPVSKSKSWSRLGQISNVISAIRNILVFVPVLLTWLAIGRAINAFGKFTKSYAEKNPGTTKNLSFIEFWQDPDGYLEGWWRQNGNGNTLLTKFWRIGDVAALDAYIILVIIVLTAISGAVTWFAENRESISLEKADRKRVEVGLAIASSLHGKRQANPESISEALAEALNDLTQAARDVNETASRLEQASIGVESLTPRIEILNSHTEQLVAQTATSVSKAVSDLVVSVQNLNSSVGGNVTTLFTEAANTLEEVSKQLARTSNSAEYGIKQLRDDLDAIHKQLQSLTKGGRP